MKAKMENSLATKNKRGWRQDAASVLARFENKFIPEPNSGCWLWLATITGRKTRHSSGYGYIKHDGWMNLAHRRSWELYRGPIPATRHVLHRCDNTCCVNPDHLWLGTHLDNMRDANRKKRIRRLPGALNPSVKLTLDQVTDIRTKRLKPMEFAELYGVHYTTIYKILSGENWRDGKPFSKAG